MSTGTTIMSKWSSSETSTIQWLLLPLTFMGLKRIQMDFTARWRFTIVIHQSVCRDFALETTKVIPKFVLTEMNRQECGVFTSFQRSFKHLQALIAMVTFFPFLFTGMVLSGSKATHFTVCYQALQMCIAPLAQVILQTRITSTVTQGCPRCPIGTLSYSALQCGTNADQTEISISMRTGSDSLPMGI